MPISDEDLIAYLLGDASPQQRKRIETGLADDEELRARLNELRMVLGQLDALQSHYEPPADLFATTMARIDEVCNSADLQDANKFAPEVKQPVQLASSLGPSEYRVHRSTWDSTALTACVAVLFCLLLPTVLRARFESRRAQCAHNLGHKGQGLISLALMDPQLHFPAVAEEGPEAFAGIFAIRLSDLGFVKSPSDLKCASLEGCRSTRSGLDYIPTSAQLKTLDKPKWEVCRVEAGGDYSYTLGMAPDGVVVPVKCEGRSHFPILADTLQIQDGREVIVAHDGVGTNFLFEDGHVAFVVSRCWQDEIGDNPFCNIRWARAAGLNANDASLAPSHFGPLGNQ